MSRPVMNMYLTRSEQGTRLVYFHAADETGREWLAAAAPNCCAARNGVFVSCLPCKSGPHVTHASMFAANTFAHGFQIILWAGKSPREPSKDAPGFRYVPRTAEYTGCLMSPESSEYKP